MDQEREIHNDDVRLHAYRLWEERGRPWGTPELDWFKAEGDLGASNLARSEDGSLDTPVMAAAKAVGSVLGSVAGLVTTLANSFNPE